MTAGPLGDLLSVVIVLITLYLALSLLCSTVQEALAGMRASRAKLMRERLTAILGKGFTTDIMGQALMRGLAPAGGIPSYIEGRDFASAVVGLLGERHLLEETRMHPALATLYVEAGGDLDLFRKRVADWFDSAMARLSGTYKRRSQRAMFLIGLAFAVTFDIDTVRVVTSLWQERTELTRLVEKIEAWQQARADGTDIATDIAENPDALDALAQILSTAPRSATTLPIGWAIPEDPGGVWSAGWSALTTLLGQFFSPQGWIKILGWLLTALAVVPGAQFWFDRLGGALALRAAGLRPAPTTAEAASG